MFGWLSRKTNQVERGDDCIWMSSAARIEGIRRAAERAASEGSNAAVVAMTLSAFEQMAEALAAHQPLLYRDRFERDALHRALKGSRCPRHRRACDVPSIAR